MNNVVITNETVKLLTNLTFLGINYFSLITFDGISELFNITDLQREDENNFDFFESRKA